MNNKERNRLYRTYNGLYSRHYIEEGYTCIYCACPAETLDHVPPLSWVETFGLEALRRSQIPLSTVPCCSECNRLLGARKLITVMDRLEFLEEKYHSLFEKLVRWSDDELSEMGESFQKSIRAQRYREDELLNKIRAIEQRIVKPWTLPDMNLS
jgi:hypothetical protein